MQRVPPQPEAVANCPADPASETFDNTRVHAVTVPTTLAQAPVDVILVARTGTEACLAKPSRRRMRGVFAIARTSTDVGATVKSCRVGSVDSGLPDHILPLVLVVGHDVDRWV